MASASLKFRMASNLTKVYSTNIYIFKSSLFGHFCVNTLQKSTKRNIYFIRDHKMHFKSITQIILEQCSKKCLSSHWNLLKFLKFWFALHLNSLLSRKNILRDSICNVSLFSQKGSYHIWGTCKNTITASNKTEWSPLGNKINI